MERIIESYDEFLNEAYRHFTKYFWSIDKKFNVITKLVTREYDETDLFNASDKDSNIILYSVEHSEAAAKSRADDIVKHFKKHGVPKNLDTKDADEAGYE